MAANVFNDQFNVASGSLAYTPAIALNVLSNDNDGAFVQQVSSANIDYSASNKTANTATYFHPTRPGSTLPQRSMIVDGVTFATTSNFGDIDIAVDTDTLDNGDASLVRSTGTTGIVLGTSRENLPATATSVNLAVLNMSGGAGNTFLSSVAAPANDGEIMVRPGVARFPYAQPWIGGSYSATGAGVFAHPSLTVTKTGTGQYEVAVAGVTDSRAEGFLFTMGGANSDNYSHAVALGGNKWVVNTRDNSAAFAGGEDEPFTVLYVPRSAQGLIGGHIRGDTTGLNPVIQSFGDFNIQRTSNGLWTMSVPGQTPASGVLVIETADFDRARGANVYFSYQAAANGTDFEIRQIQFEGTATNLLNDDFVVFFVPFENQIAPASPLSVTQLGSSSNASSGLSDNGVAISVNSDQTVNYGFLPANLRALAQGQIVTDKFVYVASDGVNTGTATATINLRGFNEAPFVTNPFTELSFTEDGSAQTFNLANFFADFDTTDILTYTIALNADAPVTASIVGATLTITPSSDRFGAFSYTVTATDNNGARATSSLSFGSVTAVAEGAKAINDSASTTKDSLLTIRVLSNDFDPDNAVISVSSANVLGNIDATSDATTVWSVAQTGTAPNNLSILAPMNLGDAQVAVGGAAVQQSTGVLLGTPADDSSPYGTVNSYGNTLNGTNGYWLATDRGILGTGTSVNGERNTPMGAAYFPFVDGWTSGHVNNTGSLVNGVGVTQANITRVAAGLFEVTIPEATNSETSGLLFATTASNDDNILSVRPIPGTNRWQIRNVDNDTDSLTTGVVNLEDDGFSFVYIPATAPNLIGGRWNAGSLVQTYGGASVTDDGTGTLTLSIAGQTSTTGALIAIGSGGTTGTVGGVSMTVPANLAPSYTTSGNNFVLRLRSGNTFTQTAGDIQFVFLPFAVPQEHHALNPFSITSASATSIQGASVTVNADGTIAYDPTGAGGAIGALGPGQALQDSFTYTITDSRGNTSTATVNVTVTGDRVVVTPTAGLVTTEAGGQATATITLAVQPTADVTITLTSTDPTEGLPSVSSIVFTTANWNVPQTITINGIDDFSVDGSIAYTIITTASSADPQFEGVVVSDLSIINADNDVAGISVSPTTGLSTSERGTTATFAVVLTSQPSADVSIDISSNNTAEGTLAISSLTFTSSNWSVPQTVTVTGVDDAVIDGDRAYSIVTNPAVSADALYNGLNPANVAVTNLDFDIAMTTSTGATQYGLGMPAIGVDGRLTIPGTNAFLTGGILTVTVTQNANANDRLTIRNEGTAAGQVGVSGADVTFGGTAVGTFAGGTGTPLVITFNASATRLAAQAVARAVSYSDITPNGSGSRIVTFALVDGDGVVVPTRTKEVTIGQKRVIELQEGVDRGYGVYFGARDVQISQNNANTTFPTGGDSLGLLVDFPDAGATNTAQVLLRFEGIFGTSLGQVPSDAVISSATLTVQTNNTGDGARFHRMKDAWNASTATWNNVGGGVRFDTEEPVSGTLYARTGFDSVWGTLDVSGATGTGSMGVSVTPDIRAWASSETNNGWLLAPHDGGTDGWQFSASDSAIVDQRPILRIEWLPAGTTSISVKEGINGYAGTEDTAIVTNNPTPAGNNDSLGTDFPASAAEQTFYALLKFKDLFGNQPNQIPVNSRIDDAVLTLGNVTNNAMGDGGQFRRMLRSWSEDTATFDSFGNGIQIDDVEASTTVSNQAGFATLDPDAQAGFTDYVMTSDLQAWARGAENNGWGIFPWQNGTNGWFFASSENAAIQYRPKLEVFYTELPNNAPTDIVLSAPVVHESFPAGTTVGSFSSVDPDAGNTFTYSLVTGSGDVDNAVFQIVNGTLATAAAINGSRSSYSIRVRSTDQGGTLYTAQSYEEILTIVVGTTATVTPQPQGVNVQLSGPVDTSRVNLYDQGTTLGASDVSLVGSTVGEVRGSLVFNADNRGFTFVPTGPASAGFINGLLPPDTYTFTMLSGSTGFGGVVGSPLLTTSGTPGDYVTTFTLTAPSASTVVVSIPDFARGFDQAVNVPNTSTGLPVLLSNGNDIGTVEFQVSYNPALLTISGFTSSVVGATVVTDFSTAGLAKVRVTSTTAFATSDGEFILGAFAATVPLTAPYGSKEVLRISGQSAATPRILRTDGSTVVPALADNAVHLAAFVGDLNGDETYNGVDAILMRRLIVGINSGSLSYQLADPVLFADLNVDGGVGGVDAVISQRLVVGSAGSIVPDLPSSAGTNTSTPGGPDPVIFVPTDLTASAGGTVVVPVRLRVTEAAGIDLTGVSLVMQFDATRFQLASANSISLSPLLTSSGFSQPSVNFSNGNGAIRFFASGATGLLPNGSIETLINVTLNVLPGATSGSSSFNIRANNASLGVGSGNQSTALNNADLATLVLNPAPTNGSADVGVDGVITVTGTSLANPTVVVTAPNAVYSGTAYVGASFTLTGTAAPTPTVSFTYYAGATATGTALAGAPINVGTYTVVASSAANAANNAATSAPVTFQITPKALTATATAGNKIYDGTTAATVTYTSLAGFVGTETVTVSGSGTFASKNAATGVAVTATAPVLADGTNGGLAVNYSLPTPTGLTANITAKALTATATAGNKIYDGTTAATVAYTSLAGFIGTETVTVSGSGTFASKNAATGIAVTATAPVLADGTNGGLAVNYSLPTPTGLTANITAKALTATATAGNKIYDGTTAATVAYTSLAGFIGTETVTASGSGTFASKNAATGIAVTATAPVLADGTNGGLAVNYSLPTPTGLTANITAKALTATATAGNKIYDGTTAATVAYTSLAGFVGTETVTVSGSGTFASKNAASGIAVTATTPVLADGTNGGLAVNYSLPTPTGLTANITAKALTATATAGNKIYDGTTAATVAYTSLAGFIGTETVTASGSGTFASKNAATGIAVTATAPVLADGTNGGLAVNYSLPTPTGLTANITAKALTVAADAKTKGVGAADPAFTFVATGLVPSETIATALSGSLTRDPGETAGTYTIRQGSLAAVNDNYAISFTTNTLTIAQAVTLSGSPLVNAGAAQRSQLTSLTVNFSAPVTLTAGAFSITNIGLTTPESTALAQSQILVNPSFGTAATTFTITFGAGAGVVARSLASGGNSLVDGNYRLDVDATKVVDAVGGNLAGATTFGAAATDNFFRLFGDVDGTGAVDANDLFAWRRATAAYNALFDANGDGAINSVDNDSWKPNYGKRRRAF